MEYKYEVALSFAEEDRNIALSLALALELEGIQNIYYYPLYFETTWGEELEARLSSIYRTEARYAIVLVSDQYFLKKFSQIELAAIKERVQHSQGKVYMLPVLLNACSIETINTFSPVGYIKWDYNPKAIAELMIKLLGEDMEVIEDLEKKGSVGYTLFTKNEVNVTKVIINDDEGVSDGKTGVTIIRENKFDGEEFILNRKKKKS